MPIILIDSMLSETIVVLPIRGCFMEERRKLPRRHLYYYSRVFDEDTREMAGRLVDITSEGMMMISEGPIKKDALFKFKLVLPRAIDGKKSLVIEAQNKWSKQTSTRNLYDNGFKLVNITTNSAAMIERLIKSTGINI